MTRVLEMSTGNREELASLPTGTASVAVLFDYWNARQGAKQAISRWQAQGRQPQSATPGDGHFNPILLAQRIVARRPDYPGALTDRRLALVGIYKGIPDQRRDPAGHARTRRQIQRWRAAADRAEVRCLYGVQQLIYSRDGQPREKGIDAMAAADVVLARAEHAADVVVLFSGDSDLRRALHGAHRLGAACETAAWSYGDRRFGPEPFIRHRHTLSPADYAHASRGENV